MAATLGDSQHPDYDSLYLCADCHHPLYVGLNSEREVCLNDQCVRWPAGYSSIVEAQEEHSPGIYQELREQQSQILDNIRRCNLSSLRRFAHEERRKLNSSFLSAGAMPINQWHAISELLVLTQKELLERLHYAGDENESAFAAVLQEIASWAAHERQMEDLRTGRYRILRRQDGTPDLSPFALKYLVAVRNESGFEYQQIETAATPSPPTDTTDLADLLETLWPFTLQFRRALRTHSRTTQLYRFQPQAVDLSVLAGYWVQSGVETSRIPVEKERDEIEQKDAHLRKYSGGRVTMDDFVKRYIDCEEQAPVLVRTKEGWLLDKSTLLLFILYLQGEPSLVDGTTPRLNEPLLDRMRSRAGHEFEIWLRAKLRDRGFRGPEQPVRVHYEYDILMASDTRRTVLLVEAKYRDIHPASVTGANLLSHELLAEDALLAQAKRQEDRLAFFVQNKSAFEKFLGSQQTWGSYDVRSYLVTKSPPLISRYGNTTILKASEFLESIGP